MQYREMRGGFECIHLPSIDITSVQPGHHQQMSSGSTEGANPPRTSLVKKASKLSFAVKRDKGKEREKERERERENSSDKDKELPTRPSTTNPLAASQSDSSSFFNVSAHNGAVGGEGGGGGGGGGNTNNNNTAVPRIETNGITPLHVSIEEPSPPLPSPSTKPKVLPAIPRDVSVATPQAINPPTSPQPTGEVNREVFESMGNNTLSVRFEINIVKVSLSYFLLEIDVNGTECLGTMVAPSRDTIPESEWGWMAVSNVGETSAYGTQAVNASFFFIVSFLSSFRSFSDHDPVTSS